MLRLSELSRNELTGLLKAGRLRLQIGDYSLRLTSSLPQLADGLADLYQHYRVAEFGAYDWDLEINPASMWRHWLRRNALLKVSGQAPFLPMAADHAHALFEWGVNWTVGGSLHQFLVLHSAVMERKGVGVLLPATSGSGKSTLAAELALRGWRLLSDELALIDSPELALVPFPRPVSLKNDSIMLIRHRHPEAVIGPIARDTHKGTIAHLMVPDDSVTRACERVRPRLIVFPKWEAKANSHLLPVGQGQAAMRLIDQSFNYPVLGGVGFEALGDLVHRADAWDLRYSNLDEAVAVLDELVDECA